MTYFDKKPNLFRIIVFFLFAFLFFVGLTNFVRYASSPTDENLFTNIPSRIMVNVPIPLQNSDTDLLEPGDLIIKVQDKYADSLDTVYRLLSEAGPDAELDISFFRPRLDKKFSGSVQAADIDTSMLQMIPPSVYIISVAEGGASDRAGMLPGDLVYRINGKDFESSAQADRIMRQGSLDKLNDYDIYRAAKKMTLHVKLARFGFAFSIFSAFLSGILFMFIGTWLGIIRPQFIGARQIALTFIFFGYAIAIIFNRRDIHADWITSARDILLILSIFISIGLWFNSNFYFPRIEHKLLGRKWIRRIQWGLVALSILLTIMYDNSGFFGSLTAIVLFNLIVNFIYRKEFSLEGKQVSRSLKWTARIVGVLLIGMSIYNSVNQGAGIYYYFGLVLLILPVTYLYTIGRYRLFDLDLRVRRNIQYTALSWGWGLLILLALVYGLEVLPTVDLGLPNIRFSSTSLEITDEALNIQERVILEKFVLMIVAVFLTYLAWKIRGFGQQLIDRKYFRSKFDHRRAATELAEMMSTRLNMVDLARGIAEKITDLLHLKQVGVLFFKKQETCCCREGHGFDGKTWDEFCVKVDKDVMRYLNSIEKRDQIYTDDLPTSLNEDFRKRNIRIIIPIYYKQKIVGALLIGEKLSESPFDQEDLSFLSSAARQASVAIENAFLYEELTEQERLKHELDIARRIQLSSLPEKAPEIEGLQVAGQSRPALEVGGDYYDYLNGADNGLTVIVGDVSGKGTSAALYMSRIQGIMRSLHSFELNPRDLFIRANILLNRDIARQSFVTALGALFDTRKQSILFARAGHLPIFYFDAVDNSVKQIAPSGIGIGLDKREIFQQQLEEMEFKYTTGDVFLFVTDGVTEAFSSDGDEFGEERVAELLKNMHDSNVREIRDAIFNSVEEFTGDNDPHDDQTVVVVKAV